jgi:hypothetical protein
MTAIVTAITALLTILILFLWVNFMYNKPLKDGLLEVFGVLLILLVDVMVELKPSCG